MPGPVCWEVSFLQDFLCVEHLWPSSSSHLFLTQSLRRILVALAILTPARWAGTSSLGELVYLLPEVILRHAPRRSSRLSSRELNAEDLNQEATDISLTQTSPLALSFSLVTSAPIILGCCPQRGQCHRHPIAFAHKHASEAISALANDSINVEQQQQQPSEPTLDYLAHLHTLITWFIARNAAQITHKSPNGKMGNSQTGLNQQHRKSLSLWHGRR
ncbi:hypothetical protein PCASD_26354 [Puccinia coronata f. sp. avenae]|uniref:Uncharacterized protein n=1 Tax=Puccinia coronata f. sp. avenae TaxID=200324 RepID=A0A2N5TK88_9BASI|nr:hypothetical protein PCASD_26354 [Puccinia coronata f. sp. avenae]